MDNVLIIRDEMLATARAAATDAGRALERANQRNQRLEQQVRDLDLECKRLRRRLVEMKSRVG